MAKLGDILYRGSEEQCRALMGRLQSGELTADQVKDLYAQAQQAAEQPAQDSVFSKLSPEQQQEMTDSVKAMLQTLIDADVKTSGEVTQGTLDAIQTQGFFLSDDGTLQRAGARPAPEPQAEAPALDPAAEPVVTILFSESPHLETGQQMPLHEADALFAKLDAEHQGLPSWTPNTKAAATTIKPISALTLLSKAKPTAIPGGRILATGTVP